MIQTGVGNFNQMAVLEDFERKISAVNVRVEPSSRCVGHVTTLQMNNPVKLYHSDTASL